MNRAGHSWKRWAAALALVAVPGVLGMLTEEGWAQAGKSDKVVFARLKFNEKSSTVMVMNPDGSGLTKVGKGEGLAMDPALSPDGKQVAFTAVDLNTFKGDVYVINLDGSGKKQLTKQDAKTLAFAASWSPDGKRIAYSTMKMDELGPPKEM